MLENIFKLNENGTSVRTEILAGLATFLTMAYIIVVNPAILSTDGTGMDFGGVFVWELFNCPPNPKNHGTWSKKISGVLNQNFCLIQ